MNNIGRHEETGQDTLENEYDEEVMYAGWNPLVTCSCQQQCASNEHSEVTPTSTIAEAETFLKKIYASQR